MNIGTISLNHIVLDRRKKLGSGYIADVIMGTDQLNNQRYAVKIINLSKVTPAEFSAIKREI